MKGLWTRIKKTAYDILVLFLLLLKYNPWVIIIPGIGIICIIAFIIAHKKKRKKKTHKYNQEEIDRKEI